LIHEGQRKFKSASEAFAAAIRLKLNVKEIYLAKAEADRFRNANEEAIAAARKATEIDPGFADAFVMLGDLLQYDKERRAEAISALQTAIRLKPTLAQPYNILGNIFLGAKSEKDAEEIFRKGMDTDPKHMAGRFELGRLLVKQGKLEEARQLWEGRTSDEDNAYPQFIQLLTRAENLKKATAGLAQNPNDPDTLVDMGLAVMDGDYWVVDGRQKRALAYCKPQSILNELSTPVVNCPTLCPATRTLWRCSLENPASLDMWLDSGPGNHRLSFVNQNRNRDRRPTNRCERLDSDHRVYVQRLQRQLR